MLTNRQATVVSLALSAVVFAFLFWILYFRPDAAHPPGGWVDYLPAVNASLNSLATLFIVAGIIAIRQQNKKVHIACMISATASSALFLVTYITYHTLHGDTKFLGTGPIRTAYLTMLASHVVLSMLMVPMIFMTLFLSITRRFEAHKKLARWTYPIWLYVSVTGVLIFLALRYWPVA